jgi:predicted aspartyl protease
MTMIHAGPARRAATIVLAALVAIAPVAGALPSMHTKGFALTQQRPGLPPDRLRTGVHRIPAEYHGGVFFAKATIDGAGPFWLTVDTGATLTVIDPRTAGRLGLQVRDIGPRQDVGTASGPTSMGTTRRAAIRVGDLALFTPQRLFVVAVSANEELLGHRVDGVLGTDFLSRHVLELDYRAGSVTAHDPGAFEHVGREAPIAISLERNRLIAPATLTLPDGDTLSARLLIDTGSNTRLTLNAPFVRRYRLIERFPSATLTASYGINGLTTSPLITARSLALGAASIEHPNTGLSRETSGLHASADFDGIIGAELLKAFRVIVDYPRRQLILESPAAMPRPRPLHLPGVRSR